MLAGRAAEEVVMGEISTGATNDLERATETARQMVARFGMTDALGPVTYGRPAGARFLGTPFEAGEERNFSEETARTIDAQVRLIIDGAHERAVAILREHRPVLERIALDLLAKETLERDELEGILREAGLPVRRQGPQPGPPPVTVAPDAHVGVAAAGAP